jgi:hypothetical protein
MRLLVCLPGVEPCLAPVPVSAGANATPQILNTIESGGAAPCRPNLDRLFEDKP